MKIVSLLLLSRLQCLQRTTLLRSINAAKMTTRQSVGVLLSGLMLSGLMLSGLVLVCVCGVATAQTRTITGKVTQATASNPAIGGVKVLAKGTNKGTFTKPDGTYSINAPSDAKTLVFEYIGYKKKEAAIGGTDELNVQLVEDVLKLEELVVTAIGIKQEKRALSYATQEVKGDAIQSARSTNVVNALAGQVAGVRVTNSTGSPGGSSFIQIRGVSSLTGNNQPLFVVDGVPINNDPSNLARASSGAISGTNSVDFGNRALELNPDDIESVNVLKGAAATALYGLNASAGAIIITTKKGSSGTVNVNYSYSLGFDNVNKLPELQNKYSQGLNGLYRDPSTGASQSWGARIDTLLWTGTNDNPWDKNGRIVGASQRSAFPNAKQVTPYDPFTFFETGRTQQHNLNISGGSNVATFFSSISYLTSTGVVPNSSYDRLTARVSADYKMFEDLTIGGSFQYTRSGANRIERGSNTSGVTLGLYRTPPTFDNSGGVSDPARNKNSYIFPTGSVFGGASIAGRQRTYRGYGVYDNPYWVVNQQPLREDIDRVIGTLDVKYVKTDWFLKDVLGDLSITWRLGNDFASTRWNQSFAVGGAAFPTGRLIINKEGTNILNSDVIVGLNKEIAEGFRANLSVGHNLYQRTDNSLLNRGDGFVIPEFYHLSNTASPTVFQFDATLRRMALYATAGVEIANMLYINGNIRSEQSTTLPVKNNTFSYGGVSAGFVFTELDWLKDNEVLPYGKIRASYATTGSDAPVYSLATLYTQAGIGDGWTTGVNFPFNGGNSFQESNTLGNKNLRPEKRTELELGLELKFFQNRLSIDATYYKTDNVDQIFSAPIASSTGYNLRFVNAGTMENSGLELNVNGSVIRGEGAGDFSFDVGVNFSTYKNLVKSLAPGVSALFLGGFNGGSIQAVAGQPYGSIYGLGWLRNDNGQLVIVDGQPVPNAAETAWGSAIPNWTMGIRPQISLAGFTLVALLDIKSGGVMWNGTRGALNFFGTSKESENREALNGTFGGVTFVNNVAQGVAATTDANGELVISNTPNTAPLPKAAANAHLGQSFFGTNGFYNTFNAGMGEPFAEDASWVRLRELTLTYRFPKEIVEALKITRSIELSVTGRNLWLSTKYTGVDPETSLLGASNAQGLDYFNFPSTKGYTFTLRVGF